MTSALASWRGSLRARTVTVAVLVTMLFGVVGSLALMWQLQTSLVRSVDTSLSVQSQTLATTLLADRPVNPLLAPLGEAAFFQVVGSSGRVLASSASVQGQDALTTFAPLGQISFVTLAVSPLGAGERIRVSAERLTFRHQPATLYVGQSLSASDQSIRDVRDILSLAGPLLVLVVGVLTWLLVARSLAPVEAMRVQVNQITMRDLSERLAEPASGDELARLAATLNAMLARLHASHLRQQSFVADASHELKSPLAAAVAELQVSLAHPELTQWPQAAHLVLGDLDRMSAIINDLLDLARFDEHARRENTVVDLADLVAHECTRLDRTSAVALEVAGHEKIPVMAQAQDLSRALRNVLVNAVAHATTRVSVAYILDAEFVEVHVVDDGPGIAPEDRERVFHRFARLDSARSRTSGGSGLGLAIVKAIVDAHDGSVFFLDDPAGAHCVIRLPRIEATRS